MENKESFIPYVGKIIDIRQETPDVKTFSVVGLDGKKLFEHIPVCNAHRSGSRRVNDLHYFFTNA